MNNDWLDELNEIREADKAKQAAQAKTGPVDAGVLGRREQASLTLRKCEAHKLLRRVRSVLLADRGLVDVFDRVKDYDQAIALLWQGPVSNARTPKPDDPEACYCILVGAKGDKLFVNNQPVRPATPDALKPALVRAAKNPLRWSTEAEK
jgi:hypothetical protein